MAVLRQLFEQQGLGHVVLGKQSLFALSLDRGKGAVACFPNAQSGHRDARRFRHCTDTVQGGGRECAGVQNKAFE